MNDFEMIRRDIHEQSRGKPDSPLPTPDSLLPTPDSPFPTPHSQLPTPDSAIRVKDLWKRYGSVDAVRGVSLEASEGEIFGLIGPDGAGKTTTFQILAGVMEADSGAAEVFGRPAREMRAQT